jgi:hypothetical protein
VAIGSWIWTSSATGRMRPAAIQETLTSSRVKGLAVSFAF